jgi:3-deoxy-D-manno-octulosonate 8-phosphate phosphatase (KDO 8-P phosphatase)
MIELIVLDIDGCMTDGKITYTASGDELKSFNVKDGFAIVQWIRMGRRVAIITGRESAIVARRAKELGVEYCYQGIKDKLATLTTLCESLQISFENVAAIGDDLNDAKLLKAVGVSFAPADAMHYITEMVDVVLSKKGGDGAVREMIELLVKEEGLQEEYLSRWL